MLKIGITGQSGFVGTHLYNTLALYKENFIRIPFDDEFFLSDESLKSFVSKCDVIVHLAALNRHNDPQAIYETNIRLVKQLISACDSAKSLPYVIFSSSTQEEGNNLYGKSKKEGRLILEEWSKKRNSSFTGLVIPNVYGPFGHPNYNSVVATFCHQLTHDDVPKIDLDSELQLIYVGELVGHIIQLITNKQSPLTFRVPHTATIRVSALLQKLVKYKENYAENGTIPDIENTFDRNLWNTFVCYIDHASFFPFNLNTNKDSRGCFVEILRINNGGQISFSKTYPGITRGNHFHTHKAERFAVIKGKARIEFRRFGTDNVYVFNLDDNHISFVDMPIWYTHKITNVGDEDLYTIFWVSEHFDLNDPDTFFEEV